MANHAIHDTRRSNVVRLDVMDAGEHDAENSWPATIILPVACLTGAAMWSLAIFAGFRLF